MTNKQIKRAELARIADRDESSLPDDLRVALVRFRDASRACAERTLDLARTVKRFCVAEAEQHGVTGAEVAPYVRRLMTRLTRNKAVASQLFSICELDERCRAGGQPLDLSRVVSQGVLLAMAAAARDDRFRDELEEMYRWATDERTTRDEFRARWRRGRSRSKKKALRPLSLEAILAFVEVAEQKDVLRIHVACEQRLERLGSCARTTTDTDAAELVGSGTLSSEQLLELRATCDAVVLANAPTTERRALNAAMLAFESLRTLGRFALDPEQDQLLESAQRALKSIIRRSRDALFAQSRSANVTPAV